MNVAPNGANDPCVILTQSSATLSLSASDEIKYAFLYWAGSGPGDFDVQLNGQNITAEREFGLVFANTGLPFFSAFADVTAQIQATGNGNYTLSELDVSPWLNVTDYCINGTNFAGWTLVVIYENAALPLNQLNVYDGLKNVPLQIDITLENLNVIDNEGAKIGVVAWEGDANLANNENLSINDNPLSDPPLNPANNAFNGTNSFTGSDTLYNMDLDVYDIQNNIAIGDSTAHIQLTSGIQVGNQVQGDFVMINVIVTKLNSQLPDATIVADNVTTACNSRAISVDFTVSNLNSTDALPAATAIAFFADGILLGTTLTTTVIPIGGSENGQVNLVLPDGVPDTFTLTLSVDNNGTGIGSVTELNEDNNDFATSVSLPLLPDFNQPENLVSCNEGLTSGTFDFSNLADAIAVNPTDAVTFHHSQQDAEDNLAPILNTSNYHANTTPETIWFRIVNDECYNVGSFLLTVRNCPPIIYNFVSNNNDGINDYFHIVGLRDIFLDFELSVYNRWGILVWKGNNNLPDWDGVATKGLRWDDKEMPDGTYYYVLELHDPGYQKAFTGFLYLAH
ncbi:MAG: gliding motility-associated C-terminal domain-containing protein [Flavobacterium sp.]|nr:MAG: gliding motility-associated C-terminal domain-containing protein [Flavobacterium sp.]